MSRITVSMLRVPNVGIVWPLYVTSPVLSEASTLSFSVTSLLWWTRGSSSILMPTSLYWNAVIGTMLPPIVCEVLKVVVGIGSWLPITRLPFCPSVMRSWGWASACASPADLMRFTVTVGSTMFHIERVMSGMLG